MLRKVYYANALRHVPAARATVERRLADHTVESYGRDLSALAAFATAHEALEAAEVAGADEHLGSSRGASRER